MNLTFNDSSSQSRLFSYTTAEVTDDQARLEGLLRDRSIAEIQANQDLRKNKKSAADDSNPNHAARSVSDIEAVRKNPHEDSEMQVVYQETNRTADAVDDDRQKLQHLRKENDELRKVEQKLRRELQGKTEAAESEVKKLNAELAAEEKKNHDLTLILEKSGVSDILQQRDAKAITDSAFTIRVYRTAEGDKGRIIEIPGGAEQSFHISDGAAVSRFITERIRRGAADTAPIPAQPSGTPAAATETEGQAVSTVQLPAAPVEQNKPGETEGSETSQQPTAPVQQDEPSKPESNQVIGEEVPGETGKEGDESTTPEEVQLPGAPEVMILYRKDKEEQLAGKPIKWRGPLDVVVRVVLPELERRKNIPDWLSHCSIWLMIRRKEGSKIFAEAKGVRLQPQKVENKAEFHLRDLDEGSYILSYRINVSLLSLGMEDKIELIVAPRE